MYNKNSYFSVLYALIFSFFYTIAVQADTDTQVSSVFHKKMQHQFLKGQFLRGRNLFLNEEFGGNGRTCASCHLRRNIVDNFDFTPADAQALFAEDPTPPLFREIDQDPDGSFTTLLNHGLVRIPFVLPPNMTVLEVPSVSDAHVLLPSTFP